MRGKHSWESLPEREKGEGRFYRRRGSGGRREDLRPEMVEKIIASILEKFCSGSAS